MKLRNKKTEEIGELQITEKHCAVAVGNGTASCEIEIYNSLAELNEEWEDYGEPKDHWYINYQGEVYVLDPKAVPEYSRNAKEIGNYFETREEAEEAVEKLKAWKRLKDKGFEITGFEHIGVNGWVKGSIGFLIPKDNLNEADLDAIFGGEE